MNVLVKGKPLRKLNVGAVLTWAQDDVQLVRTQALVKFAPRVYVHSDIQPIDIPGVFWQKAKKEEVPPTLLAVVHNYMMKIPGNEVAVLTGPNVEVVGSIAPALEAVEIKGWTNAWAGFFRNEDNEVPFAFIASATVLAQLVHNIPETLKADSFECRNWLHQWLSRYLMRPRYMDLSTHKILSVVKETAPINAYDAVPAPTLRRRQRKPNGPNTDNSNVS